jgi:hypothetical protein
MLTVAIDQSDLVGRFARHMILHGLPRGRNPPQLCPRIVRVRPSGEMGFIIVRVERDRAVSGSDELLGAFVCHPCFRTPAEPSNASTTRLTRSSRVANFSQTTASRLSREQRRCSLPNSSAAALLRTNSMLARPREGQKVTIGAASDRPKSDYCSRPKIIIAPARDPLDVPGQRFADPRRADVRS